MDMLTLNGAFVCNARIFFAVNNMLAIFKICPLHPRFPHEMGTQWAGQLLV